MSASATWGALLPAAMVGTERLALPATPTLQGPVGDLIAAATAQSTDNATALLRAAGIVAACSLAGVQGQSATSARVSPAPADLRPPLAAGPLLAQLPWVIAEGPHRLHQAVFQGLDRAGLQLPPRFLPAALELGRRSVALRPWLAPVLGERGHWLAAQREEWRYATGASDTAPPETLWSEGNLEQRKAFLRSERTHAADTARQRLSDVLPELPARERAELAATLTEGLSLADEPLLDRLRQDRSREVRSAALALLLRLQQAAFTQRATTRIAALLKHERALPLLRKRWTIDAPTALPPDAKTDHLDASRPQNDKLGERAWWLYQCVGQVPLAWWQQHLESSPTDLLAWAQSTEWAQALLRGWRDVLLSTADPQWCLAFLQAPAAARQLTDTDTLVALLPRTEREAWWKQQLERGAATHLGSFASQMLAGCPAGETLSQPLSLTVAVLLRERAQHNTLADDYGVRQLLGELLCIMHPEALHTLDPWPRHADETPSFAAIVLGLTQVIATQRALVQLSTSSATP
ncbi:DUF5691 domain-containing protein [Acidovorax sp.]|uniref:DUF5691 domain-containing protein n=1 Tax=Acidovorax sp. TaxID=1872122 RepID=UPI00260A63F1|nr:DUF5691 domain-containing protein [Acidovorax sp.]